MKLALNQATLMKTPMEHFLEAASKASFEGVELRRDETFSYLKYNSVSDLKKLLVQFNLKCITFNAIELFSLCSNEEFKKIQKYTEKLMEIGNEIDCDTLIAVPSFLEGSSISSEKIKKQTTERLIILKKLADKYDFKLAFEPLGFMNCSVRKLSTALEIINNENLSDIGLVIDTFHFFLGGHSIEILNSIDLNKIWLIHINDVAKKSWTNLKDSDRVLPGQGNFNLKDFMNTLKIKGYDKWLSLELFNETLWKEDPHEVALNSIQAMKKFIVLDS
ncbi:MAG: sugar phosphate isomerase/epimerase family protein [Promethearchaeota archaeon]